MIKKFKQYNESLRDQMTPKSTDDMIEVLKTYPPYKAYNIAKKNNLDSAFPDIIKRVKPVNAKLFQDIKKYDKKNLKEFLDFMEKWVKEQGGSVYGVRNNFDSLLSKLTEPLRGNNNVVNFNENKISLITEDEEEEEEYDEDYTYYYDNPEEYPELSPSYYSDKTIEAYIRLVAHFAVDEVSNNQYDDDDDDDEEEYYDEY